MKRYSIGFLFNTEMTEVLMIEKKRPTWQSGLLNGIGGHIEEGETPVLALVREIYEEAGVVTTEEHWQHVVTLRFPYAELEVFALNYTHTFDTASTKTDELIIQVKIDNLSEYKLIENIQALIQLCIQRLDEDGNIRRKKGCEER